MKSNGNATIQGSGCSPARAELPQPARLAEGECIWKATGRCRGLRLVGDGRRICTCAEQLMAPSPDQVIETFTDLGLTDEQIGRYFHIPASCITAMRCRAC